MSEQTLEAQQLPAITPPPFRFSKENAAQMQAKAVLARKERELSERQEMERLQAEAQANQARLDAIATMPDEQYRLEQLKRVRGKIDQLWTELEQAEGGKELQAITTAIEKLSNMEFNLAKRPKPAAYRTAPEKPKRSQASTGPVED